MSTIGPGDVVTIRGEGIYYYVITMSGNGKIAFLRLGTPDNPGKRYVTMDTDALIKQHTLEGKKP